MTQVEEKQRAKKAKIWTDNRQVLWIDEKNNASNPDLQRMNPKKKFAMRVGESKYLVGATTEQMIDG